VIALVVTPEAAILNGEFAAVFRGIGSP